MRQDTESVTMRKDTVVILGVFQDNFHLRKKILVVVAGVVVSLEQ